MKRHYGKLTKMPTDRLGQIHTGKFLSTETGTNEIALYHMKDILLDRDYLKDIVRYMLHNYSCISNAQFRPKKNNNLQVVIK